jgi:hypothetical protein
MQEKGPIKKRWQHARQMNKSLQERTCLINLAWRTRGSKRERERERGREGARKREERERKPV